jgi:hypothetical protein
MSQTRKVVQVSYVLTEEFIVPKGLDLQDQTQVKLWYVKYNVLHITKADGTKLEINSENIMENYDYKFPYGDGPEIIDADEACCFEKFQEEDEEDEEDEDEDEVWAAASGIALNRLERGETHEGRICEKCSSGEKAVMIHKMFFMCEACRNEMLGLK